MSAASPDHEFLGCSQLCRSCHHSTAPGTTCGLTPQEHDDPRAFVPLTPLSAALDRRAQIASALLTAHSRFGVVATEDVPSVACRIDAEIVAITTGVWHPPAGQPVRTVLADGAVGPNGEVSHGLCEECAAAFRAEARS